MSVSWLRILGLMVVSACLAAGCSGVKKIDVGGACILNSDCNQPLVCTMGKCHDACHTTADCPAGQCVKVDNTTFCQLPAEADCSTTLSCSGGLVCASDLRCRAACLSRTDCTSEQMCVNGVCAAPSELDVNGQLPQKGPSLVADGGVNVPDASGRGADLTVGAADAQGRDAGVNDLAKPASDAPQPTQPDSGPGTGSDTKTADSGGEVNCTNCPCSDFVAKGSPGLVDDLNDGDGYILDNDGRHGGWYTYNDDTGVQTPAAPPPYVCEPQGELFRPTNGQACTSGSGFTSWGAALGVSLLTGENCISCKYDATAYTGVRFTISGSVVGSLRFMVATMDTLNVRWGGNCVDDTVCTDEYGTNVSVTTQPQVVEVPWTILRQSGWGTPALFNVKELTNLNWQVNKNTTAPVSFDSLCIDDVSFY
jgi:hypothetical protein